jgi:hypothetical protein
MPSKLNHLAWRQEIEAVHAAMDELLLATRRRSGAEERPVRQMQFAILIERRAAADREFLEAARKQPSYMHQGPALVPDSPDKGPALTPGDSDPGLEPAEL